MVKIQEAFFLRLPHFMVPREIDLQDNFKAIERWANTLTLPDVEFPTPAVGGGIIESGSPPAWAVNVDGTSLIIAGNILRINVGGVTLGHMADASVGTNELINDSVTNDKLANGSVDTAQIQAGAIGAAEIAGGSILSSNLSANAVSSANIANASIQSVDIATAQITSTLLATGACSFSKIGTDHPRFFVSKGSGQSLPNGARTPITFTSETYDIGNWHASGSSSFFVPDTGSYIFSGYLIYNTTVANEIQAAAEISVNDLRLVFSGMRTNWGEPPAIALAVAFYATAGQQIQLQAYHTAGAGMTLGAAAFSGAAISN